MNLNILHTDSPLGTIRISVNESAVTEIAFCDNPELLPDMEESNHPLLLQCRQELNDFFDGRLKKFTVPFHQDGTPFQQRVWNELSTILYGKTISYLDLSKRIGDVKAIRAVGTSNGKNKIAIIVPCHRVVGSDGSLTGYAGGLWRKQWLLEHEMKVMHGVQLLF